jgi:ABC-2 type transport system permease protein
MSGFAPAVRMEWIKLRSLRSAWWTLGITAAAAVGIAAAVGRAVRVPDGDDIVNSVLSGIAVGMLLIGALGVVAMSGEYSSGAIRSTLAAVPNRRVLLAAKVAVFGGLALALGEAAAFIAFEVGTTSIRDAIPAPSLTDPAVLRTVVLGGAGICLVGLIGLGIGTIVRHTAPAIGVMVGGVYVAAQVFGALTQLAMGYLPLAIVGNSLCAVHPKAGFLQPWPALGVLALYAAVLLGAGGWLLARRDA